MFSPACCEKAENGMTFSGNWAGLKDTFSVAFSWK